MSRYSSRVISPPAACVHPSMTSIKYKKAFGKAVRGDTERQHASRRENGNDTESEKQPYSARGLVGVNLPQVVLPLPLLSLPWHDT